MAFLLKNPETGETKTVKYAVDAAELVNLSGFDVVSGKQVANLPADTGDTIKSLESDLGDTSGSGNTGQGEADEALAGGGIDPREAKIQKLKAAGFSVRKNTSDKKLDEMLEQLGD